MTLTIDLESVLSNLVNQLESSVYFILISSLNGVIMKSYINEDEFNKASISLNLSQLYELAEETAEDIGLHSPDFNITHSDNYYLLTIKILEHLVLLLTTDQVEVKEVFRIINQSINPA